MQTLCWLCSRGHNSVMFESICTINVLCPSTLHKLVQIYVNKPRKDGKNNDQGGQSDSYFTPCKIFYKLYYSFHSIVLKHEYQLCWRCLIEVWILEQKLVLHNTRKPHSMSNGLVTTPRIATLELNTTPLQTDNDIHKTCCLLSAISQ